MICESIYRVLGIIPNFISSYDARTYSFPDLLALRKFNKKGEEIPLKQIKKSIKSHHVVLFGSYPYEIDKKVVMMNKVNEMYPNIDWIIDKKGEIKKENYDACDSLVCALAYVNINRNGVEKPVITQSTIKENKNKTTEIQYTVEMWSKKFEHDLTLYNS